MPEDDRPPPAEGAADVNDNDVSRVEAELAFQGDAIRELSDALATQQLDILMLKEQVGHLSSQLKALRQELSAPAAAADEADVPPPHY